MSNRARARRKRRQDRAQMRNRPSRRAWAKPSHRLQAGRTGSVQAKREPSKQSLGLHTSTPFVVPESIRLRERHG